MSTYSPCRGEDSRAALAVSSEAGRPGSRGGIGVPAGAGVAGAAAGGACASETEAASRSESAGGTMARMVTSRKSGDGGILMRGLERVSLLALGRRLAEELLLQEAQRVAQHRNLPGAPG